MNCIFVTPTETLITTCMLSKNMTSGQTGCERPHSACAL